VDDVTGPWAEDRAVAVADPPADELDEPADDGPDADVTTATRQPVRRTNTSRTNEIAGIRAERTTNPRNGSGRTRKRQAGRWREVDGSTGR
jgi:hypothetical protein